MDIAINIEVALSNPTGMGRYSRELLRHLIRLDANHSYTFFHSNQCAWPPAPLGDESWALPENVQVRPLPYSRKELLLSWLVYGGPRSLGKLIGTQGIYHDLADILLPVSSRRTIATLHDVFILMFPESFAWHSRLLFRKSWRRLRQANAIVTVSNFSKQKIVELLGIRPEAVTVVYGGTSSAFRRIQDSARIRKTCAKYGIGRGYFLFVGVFNRRKNLGSLLRAYSLYRSRRRGDCPLLVCCGRPGIGSEEFYGDIAGLGLAEDVKIVQGADDAELAELFSGTLALILPSLGEGFGLPVAEAMACGAPVICGKRCAMSEVAGEAALGIEPKDIGQIAEAMERITADPALVQTLRGRGLERAKQFSWERTAQEMLALYERAH